MKLEKETALYDTEAIKNDIDEAYNYAGAAMRSANGKNNIYRGSVMPSGGTYAEGDVWFDTANDNRINRWNGSSWVPFSLGNNALESLSANKLTAGTIDASVITVSNLDAGNITTGTLSSDRINTSGITIGQNQVTGLTTALNDKVTRNDGTYATGVTRSIVKTTLSKTYSEATAYLNVSQPYTWTNVTSIGGGTWNKGDFVKIPLIITDRNNATGYILARINTYSGTTLTAYNMDLTVDSPSDTYVTSITGQNGICVHEAEDVNNFVNIQSDGMRIYQNGQNISGFKGDVVYLNNNAGNRLFTLTRPEDPSYTFIDSTEIDNSITPNSNSYTTTVFTYTTYTPVVSIYSATLFNIKLTIPSIQNYPVYEVTSRGLTTDTVIYNNNGVKVSLFASAVANTNSLDIKATLTNLNGLEVVLQWNKINCNYTTPSSVPSLILGPNSISKKPLFGIYSAAKSNVYDFYIDYDGGIYADNIHLKSHTDPLGTIYRSESLEYDNSYSASTSWSYPSGNKTGQSSNPCSLSLSTGTFMIYSWLRASNCEANKLYGISIGYYDGDWKHYVRSRSLINSNGSVIELTTSLPISISRTITLRTAFYHAGSCTLNRIGIVALRLI